MHVVPLKNMGSEQLVQVVAASEQVVQRESQLLQIFSLVSTLNSKKKVELNSKINFKFFYIFAHAYNIFLLYIISLVITHFLEGPVPLCDKWDI